MVSYQSPPRQVRNKPIIGIGSRWPVTFAAPVAMYSIEVDWDGDGAFANAYSRIETDVLGYEHERGGAPEEISGRSRAGSALITVRNETGKYNRFNTSSPLYGDLPAVGRRVRIIRWAEGVPFYRWGGRVRDIQPNVEDWTATIECEGLLAQTTRKRYEPAASAGDLTGTLIGQVLAGIGLPSSDYVLDAGDTTTSRWAPPRSLAFDLIRDLEVTEFGFIYENSQGQLVFEDRSHRLSGDGLISQDTYSDELDAEVTYLKAIQESDPLDAIANDISIPVNSFVVQALAVLWTFGGSLPTLVAGEEWEITAVYQSSGVDHVPAWTTPVVGADITQSGVANGDISISNVVKRSRSMTFTVKNNHGSTAATLTLAQARGTEANATESRVTDSDADSQEAYGESTFDLPAPYLPNVNTALGLAAAILAARKDPSPVITLPFELSSEAKAERLFRREISDRVTAVAVEFVTSLGLTADFFIERISERVDFADGRHFVTFEMSSASAAANFWILGTSVLGTSTVLGY